MLMLAGTQKAASTWLHAALAAASGLRVARKEWHFWDSRLGFYPDVPFDQGVSHPPLSAQRFAAAFDGIDARAGSLLDMAPKTTWQFARSTGALRGEMPPVNLSAVAAGLWPANNALTQWVRGVRAWDVADFTPDNVVLGRVHWAEIAGELPDLQVVVAVRNPARRAWSSLAMYVRRGWLVPEFSADEALQILSTPMHAQRSYVSTTIESLRASFPDEQVHLISVDQVARHPVESLQVLAERAGIPVPEPRLIPGPQHVGDRSSPPKKIEQALISAFQAELSALEGYLDHRLVV
jgi:hypothetical protein